MRAPKRLTVAWLVILFVSTSAPVLAGVDNEDEAITEADWSGPPSGYTREEWYVDEETGKLAKWLLPAYGATVGLIGTHCKTEDGTKLQHSHFRFEWGDEGRPKVSEADAYWDARFVKGDPPNPRRIAHAKQKHQTCHEWALKQSTRATGTYEYMLTRDDTPIAYAKDLLKVAKAIVLAGDILSYAEHAHASLVVATRGNGAGGREPSRIRWKWKGSGIYEYDTPDNAINEYDTPMCQKQWEMDVDAGNTIAEEDWSWTVDYMKNPDVYH